MNDKTQMIPPSDPNKTVIGDSIDLNATQMGNSDFNRTQMPGDIRALSVSASVLNPYSFAAQSSRNHLLLKINASGNAMARRMPLNVCLILDKSMSMEGIPMDYMKQACAYVVDLLDQNDVLSIVTFEQVAQVLMPARRIINKNLIKELIYRLEIGNTTNIYDGIALGASQVASASSLGYVNRALLFTDGEPTAGIKDFSSIVGQVTEQKSRGITITALGFGNEYNEELLGSIARQSGGNYYYITRPELIPEIFRKELETMMMTSASNVRLRLGLSRWVQVRQVYGKQPIFGNRSAEVVLGDFEKGETQTALVEVELGPRPSGKYRVIKADIIYDDSVTGKTETISTDITVDFTTDASLLSSPPNQEIKQAIEMAEVSRQLERTIMGMKTMQVTSGDVIGQLEKTRMMFLDQGKTLQANDVQAAINQINQGGGVEKTLMGTLINLDRGKSNE